MLVLRRRVGESILVGGEVEIEVIEISRSRVKLGVRAPLHVPVVRKETQGVAQENQLASDLVASRGHKGVGELMQLLSQPGSHQTGSAQNPTGGDATEDGSTKPSGSRYETPERYSGYHGDRENPHPA